MSNVGTLGPSLPAMADNTDFVTGSYSVGERRLPSSVHKMLSASKVADISNFAHVLPVSLHFTSMTCGPRSPVGECGGLCESVPCREEL